MQDVINLFKSMFNAIKYSNLLQNLQLPKIGILDVIEIIIIIAVLYKLLSSLKDTRAWVILKGLAVLLVFYMVAYICSFNVIMTIFQTLMSVIAIGIVILFQGELRKLLENIGTKDFISFNIFKKSKDRIIKKYISDKTIDALVVGCREMSKVKTGALIVLKREIPLNDYVSTGIDVDSKISSQMIIQIFEHNTPLHDGAVIIENDRISSATCYLPLSENCKISKDLGTRHRAGIGISEVSDCLVIMVSEETGAISVAENGRLSHKLTEKELSKRLVNFQAAEVKKVDAKTEFVDKKNKLTQNKRFKFLAVVCGFLLWLALANAIDPVTTKTISQIKVTVENEDILKDIDQTYSITSGKNATIVVKGRRSKVDNLSAEDFTATADLKQLSIVYYVPVTISTEEDVDVIENNNSLIVKVEELSSIECDVEIETTGEEKESLYIESIDTIPGDITITGPLSELNKIGKVVVESDCSIAFDGYSEELSPIIYDKNGSRMDISNFTLSSEKIKIVYKMYDTKEVKLNISLKNTKYENGEITEYSIEPAKIRIAGTSETLSNTSEVNVEINLELNKDSKSSNMIKNIDLNDYISDKNIHVKETDALVNVNFTYTEYEVESFTIPASSIIIKNKTEDYNYKFTDSSYAIRIKALPEVLENLSVESLKPYINVADLIEGTNNISVGVENTKTISGVVDSSIKLEVSKIEEPSDE